MEHDRGGAAVRTELEAELGVDDAIEEFHLGAGEDLEHRLVGELGEQAIALPRDIDDEALELVPADQPFELRRVDRTGTALRLHRVAGIDQVKADVVDVVAPAHVGHQHGAAPAVRRKAYEAAGSGGPTVLEDEL